MNADTPLCESLAGLYARIYQAPPWNEDWTIESALRELSEVSAKKGFSGAIARDESGLVGFSWGYQIPGRNTSRVNFEAIRGELSAAGFDPEIAYYGADTGVRPDCRTQGLGQRLILERAPASAVTCFRTKNPAMARIYRRVFGDELFSFAEESAYSGGRVYVFSRPHVIEEDINYGPRVSSSK